MSKRLLILMCSIFLIVPLLFMGCGEDGTDGATGATGATGTNGTNGLIGATGPGIVSNESCVVCHGAGQVADVAAVHYVANAGLNWAGSIEVTPVSLVLDNTHVDNTVGAVLTFTFKATNDLGRPIPQGPLSLNPNNLDLTVGSTSLTYARFYLATLIPGTRYDNGGLGTSRETNNWHRFANSSA